MILSVFAFLDDAQKSIQQFVHNCLLVAGAFLVGYILGGVLGWALGKWAFKQKSPDTLKQLGRPVGGIILALIVALLVFTGMGKPLGEGGEGKGTPNDSGNKDAATNPDHAPIRRSYRRKSIRRRPKPPFASQFGRSRRESERKYYLLDDNSAPITLEELKDTISGRKAKTKGRVVLQVLFSPDPNLAPPRNDPKVTDLTRWATEEAGLDVTFPASR